jgi:hypothetical protein
VLDELGSRRRPRIEPPSLSRTLAQRLLQGLGRWLKKLLSIAFGLAVIYVGIRLFGDETLLSHLDSFEARLQIGWERLLRFAARL